MINLRYHIYNLLWIYEWLQHHTYVTFTQAKCTKSFPQLTAVSSSQKNRFSAWCCAEGHAAQLVQICLPAYVRHMSKPNISCKRTNTSYSAEQ